MYHLQVLTPEEVYFDGMVLALIAPGSDGYLGVLSNHAPLVTTLKPGIFIITDKNKEKLYYTISSGGFLEVSNNKATVVVEAIQLTLDTIEMSGSI